MKFSRFFVFVFYCIIITKVNAQLSPEKFEETAFLDDHSPLVEKIKSCDSLLSNNFDSGLQLANNLVRQIDSIDNPNEFYYVHYLLLQYYFKKSNSVKVEALYPKVISLGKNLDSKILLAEILSQYGIYQGRKGDIASSITHFLESAELYKEANAYKQYANNLINIAVSHIQIQKPKEAIDYLTKAEEIILSYRAQVDEGKNELFQIYRYSIFAYTFLKENQKALLNYDKAKKIIISDDLDVNNEALLKEALSTYYLMNGDFEKALIYLDQVEIIYKDLGNSFAQVSNLLRKASLYQDIGEYEVAIEIYVDALNISQKNSYALQEKSIFYELGQLYLALGKSNISADYLNKYIDINDSLFDSDMHELQVRLQSEFEDNYKNDKIEWLEQSAEAQIRELKLKTQIQYILIIVLALSLIFLGFIHKGRLRIKSQNQILQEQKSNLEELNKTNQKLFAIIGHDLRSPIKDIESVLNLINQGVLDEDEKQLVFQDLTIKTQQVNELLNNLLNWGKALHQSPEINKQIIDVCKEFDGMKEFFDFRLKEKHLNLLLECNASLKPSLDAEMFRFGLRNLISNAIKFSHPGKSIFVNASEVDDFFEISVKDEGIGMPEKIVDSLFSRANSNRMGTRDETGAGIALKLINEYMKSHRGEVVVESHVNQGTLVRLRYFK